MAKREHVQPALRSLAQACRRAGLATETAAKMSAHGQFPRITRIGTKRVISSVAFDAWLRERIGTPAAAV
jgi:hypothetical protein